MFESHSEGMEGGNLTLGILMHSMEEFLSRPKCQIPCLA